MDTNVKEFDKKQQLLRNVEEFSAIFHSVFYQ